VYLQESLGREYTDIDFAAYGRDVRRIIEVLARAGYVNDQQIYVDSGGSRLVLEHPGTRLHLDVFVDELSFCHKVSWKGRLEIDGDTIPLTEHPTVILVVGVNGSGKTTTIGKIAWHLQKELGRSVLIAAGDTFRAAAAEQLALWAERAGCDFVRGNPGSDPGAVIFDAIESARARGRDVVICDTAGRLHTQEHLMDELRKVRRVISGQVPGAPHETLLTIDATTGQNGLRQALLFREAVDVTGIALTKLDGTAKGGIALAIAQELGVPVKLIGTGETLEDLRPFDADDFAQAILG
jgi:fused signal recognition particle receptor